MPPTRSAPHQAALAFIFATLMLDTLAALLLGAAALMACRVTHRLSTTDIDPYTIGPDLSFAPLIVEPPLSHPPEHFP